MSHLKNLHRSMGGTILVTGGAGYVGSHCVLELLQAGYQVGKLSNCKKYQIYQKTFKMSDQSFFCLIWFLKVKHIYKEGEGRSKST